MSAKPAKPQPRKAKPRRAPRPAVRRAGTNTFRDGSALILDAQGGTIGLIEARPRYGTRSGARRK